MAVDSAWWKDGIVYQVWPASYKDSNGDGHGDIPGIISTLEYLQYLGVDILWVSPTYLSPHKDMGYDVADYEAIDPRYGTLHDAERLIQECHRHQMKIVFDLVINHTSDQHSWFQEAKASKENAKRDWYIWRPARYDERGNRKPPTNWGARLGGSVWTWDEQTQEYYFHMYCPEMPDLNWENDEMRRALYDSAIRFWLDRGVDGFRVDVANKYSKPKEYMDIPITDKTQEYQNAHHVYCNGPRIHEFHREINAILGEYGAISIGELPHTPDLDNILSYISPSARQMNMVLLPEVVYQGQDRYCRYRTSPISTACLKRALAYHQSLAAAEDGWTTVYLENHDQARSISRFADASTEELRTRSGKLLTILLTTLSGTLFLYQGQEIGMLNVPRTWAVEDYKDCQALNYVDRVRGESPGDEVAFREAMDGINLVARDNGRTPVQWNDGPNAGFTTGKPWTRVNDNYKIINVAKQCKDPESLLNFWRGLIMLRKRLKELLVYGEFVLFEVDKEGEMTYGKIQGEAKILVYLNFSNERMKLHIPEGWKLGTKLVGNLDGTKLEPLEPWEGRVYTAY